MIGVPLRLRGSRGDMFAGACFLPWAHSARVLFWARVKVRSPPEEDSPVAGLIAELKELSCLHWESDM